jgi:hypothetical protein
MSPLSVIVIAFLLGLVAMSFAFAGGAVIVALPVAAIGIAAVMAFDFNRRRQQAKQIHDHREQAKAENVEFTSRDKETLVSE